MGVLPGWWSSTDPYRTQGPCVKTEIWHSLLQNAGFTGVDHEFLDYNDRECHETSVLISTKATPQDAIVLSCVNLVSTSLSQEMMPPSTSTLQRHLMEAGIRSNILSISHAESTSIEPDIPAIIAVDLELPGPYLQELDNDSFKNIKSLLQRSKNVVWLTRSENDGSSGPEYGLVSGLARVCHAELEGHKFMRVSLEEGQDSTPLKSKILVRTIRQMLAGAVNAYEMEFEERNGLYYICRLRSDVACQEGVRQCSSRRLKRNMVWQDAPALRLITETPGSFEGLCFIEDKGHFVPLEDDEVEIEVKAVGLNFKDCLIALGQIPSDTLGNECAGIVVRVGAACKERFHIGDRLCMSTTEAYKTYARGKMQNVCRLPMSISFTDAAAISTQFVTAWTSVVDIAHLTKGETILIHAGAGGTGQAAIQISQYLGAEIFMTVSSEHKKQILMTEYHIPNDHIFHSRDTSFATGIKHATKNRGVDVVLNSLAGDSLLASWDCLAPYGRFVEIGKKDILENSSLPMLPFNKGVTFSAFDGSIWMTERPNQAERGIKTIIDLFEKGVLHSVKPLNLAPISDVEKAFSDLAEGRTSGKTVLEVNRETIVPTISHIPAYSFESNATYVIAGGLGGLGCCIARWMAKRGARTLLLLSRSGPNSPAACALLDDLRAAGVTVKTPICDISDAGALRLILAECTKNLPPIRGCIQAAMVLQDTFFTQMHHHQWNAAVRPKAIGSWNLHIHLPPKLDFFILLSSVSAIIGLRGQSNYAAGNTFQDSLARYRVQCGEAAISIDLGAMVDDGFVANNESVRDRLLGSGAMLPISRKKFLALLEYYCDPAVSRRLVADTAQVVVGMNIPEAMKARGLDLPEWMDRPMLGPLHRVSAVGNEGDFCHKGEDRARDFRAEFVRAQSLNEGAKIVAQGLIVKLAKSLPGLSTMTIDVDQPIVSYGVDSLLAVEIRSWVAKMFQADVPTFEIMGGASFVTIGNTVASRSLLKKAMGS